MQSLLPEFLLLQCHLNEFQTLYKGGLQNDVKKPDQLQKDYSFV